MKINTALSIFLCLLLISSAFAQDTLPKAEKNVEFCNLIYQFVAESRISYRNIIKEPITVEGNWFYGSSKISLPGALKTVIKQNQFYHAYCEMLYTDSLPEAEQKYRHLVATLLPCLPAKWKSYEDDVPNAGYLKQFATSQSNSSPSVYVEIIKNAPSSAKEYTVQVRFLALN